MKKIANTRLFCKLTMTVLLGWMWVLPAYAQDVPVEDVFADMKNEVQAPPQLMVEAQSDAAAAAVASDPSSADAASPDQPLAKEESGASQETPAQPMDLASKVDALQQEVQKLRGELEVQQHNLTQLQDQQRTWYQDVDQRLANSKAAPAKTSGVKAALPKSSASLSQENAELEEQLVYQAAYKQIEARNFTQGLTDLKEFVKAYPKGQYAANAYYWIGEIQLLQGNQAAAIESLNTIVSKYPKNTKSADALYKLGSIYESRKEWSLAKQHWKRVMQNYPNSTAAGLAKQGIAKLTQAGY